jgi:hypothetical protein
MFPRTLLLIRQQHRRNDRLKAKAAAVIDLMRSGSALHFRNDRRRGAVWWLSRDAQHISNEIAQVVIKNPTIASVGDALPLNIDTPAQTWRFVEK